MNWEIGIDMYTLMCIKQITNKNLLYKKNKIVFKKIKLCPATKKKKVCISEPYIIKEYWKWAFIYFLFIYFCLRWVFVAARGLSLVAASGGYSSLRCAGFSFWWLLLLRSTGSRCMGFSSYGTWAQQLWLTGSRAQAQQLRRTGLVAPWHVGSSWTRARTPVPCIGRWILNHCATREVAPQKWAFKNHVFP